jgi:plastocyanin/uncharacterized membrane protein
MSNAKRAPLALVFSLLLAAALPAFCAPQSHTVVIRQMHFEPADLAAQPGDTILWKNEDIFSHTVTANDGSFDSGLIAPGATWQTTFKSAVAYHCRPHPNMSAQIVFAGGNHAKEGSLRFSPPLTPQQFHPILVNFTAALLPLAFLSDLLGRLLRRQTLHNAAWWMLLYSAILTPFTAAAGWWWKHSVGSDLPTRLITVHQWLGTFAAFAFVALALWRGSLHRRNLPPTAPYLCTAALLVLALVYQGSLGGSMVFGK